MKEKKTVCIIYPDWYLPLSPTTLNLKKQLSDQYKVKILAFYPFNSHFIDDVDIKYFKKKELLFKIFNKVLQYVFGVKKYTYRYGTWQKIHLIMYFLFNHFDHLIVIDPISLWFVKGYRKKNIHLLSLELTSNTLDFIDRVNLNALSSIIIQSEERLEFLTGNKFAGQVFYIQNSPVFNAGQQHIAPEAHKLIYTGTVIKEFGLLRFLDFLDAYPQYSLYIKGTVHEEENALIKEKYSHLISQKRLIVNKQYLNDGQLLDYISGFRIGLCFYDLSYQSINNFNYLTGPAGKMFTYFAAGVPVIGNSVPGMNPITTFNAGVQITELEPEAILKAIQTIETDYEQYSKNCLNAAKHFDFRVNCDKFIAYLTQLDNPAVIN